MSSQFRRDNTNFKVALGILEDIRKTDRPDAIWTKSHAGCGSARWPEWGYIRKYAEGYMITEKGREVMRRHTAHMVVSA